MGFFDKLDQATKEAAARQDARLNGTYKKPLKPRNKKDDYHPDKKKDGVIRADIYSTYGTHDLDKWFEQGAPHLTDAIYQIRDDVKQQQVRYQNQYDDLKKDYEKLQAQYDNLAKMISELSKCKTMQ